MNQNTNFQRNDESSSENETINESGNETIGKLVKRSNFLGQMASISTFNNKTFEILPYTDYSEFIEQFCK